MRKPSTELRPRLTPQVEKQLAGIQPSVWESMKYFPCSAILKSGERLDRVYLVSQAYFVRYWGIYPEDAPGKLHVSIQDVVNVEESPSRLPATLANKLYRAGESGMGYTVFTVVFRDGSRQAYVTGGAVDFIDYPTGKNMADAVEVLPHVGRDPTRRHGPCFYWCLYSDDETERVYRLGLTEPLPRETPTIVERIRRWWRQAKARSYPSPDKSSYRKSTLINILILPAGFRALTK